MERVRRLVGLPVRTSDGRVLGEIGDVLFDESARELLGLTVKVGAVMRRPRYVRRTDIVSLSGGGAVVSGPGALKALPQEKRGMHDHNSLIGRNVVATGGDGLGSVRDIILKEDKLQVWGFEISDGLVRDLVDGATFLPRQLVERLDSADPVVPHMNEAGDGNHTPGGGELQ